METSPAKPSKLLPSNAYTALAPGEVYRPIVPADDRRPEVTQWSVALGLAMVVLWSAACVYVALKAGSGIEAAIPIAVMAIFFGKLRKVRSSILENVIVQSIGQASGVVAAGAAFVVPALYINRLEPAWWHIFLACTIGGFLGVALIIPLRAYFVRDQHGQLPFPEATAINEVLVSGESSGRGAGKILLASIGIGALHDFLVDTVHAWNAMMSTSTLLGSWGHRLGALRLELRMNGLAALFGLGYIIGLRYTAVIAAGSVLAYVVLVPLIFLFGSHVESFSYAGQTYAGATAIAGMSAAEIFTRFVRPIGLGAIAISGVIGLLRMGRIIVGSMSLGFKGIGKKREGQAAPRTQLDMHPTSVLLIQGASSLAMGALFFIVSFTRGNYGAGQSVLFAVAGMLVGLAISFLFTPVAAQAIATVGTNPVSGMTLITLVAAAAVMTGVGLSGPAGMFISLVIGIAVCTALSTSGGLITDFKIGYWIGSTPRNQQIWKFLGVILASLTVAFVVPLMDHGYHFLVEGIGGQLIPNTDVMPAPQANMLAAVTNGLMSHVEQPILLYCLGGLVAVLLYMAGVPMLAFSLGMYLPVSINVAMLAGGFAGWVIGNSGGSEAVRKARNAQGSLIASGLMAGAAIIGILSAVLRLTEVGAPIRFLSVGERFFYKAAVTGESVLRSETAGWYDGLNGQMLGLVTFAGLALACYGLAYLGARWEMAEADAAEKGEGGPPAAG
jgi:putative OPT family oligopeptide transporter